MRRLKRSMKWALLAIAVLSALLGVTAARAAQSGGGFDLSWNSVTGGGGKSQGGGFTLFSSSGQPGAGAMSGGGFTLGDGYFAAASFAPDSTRPLCVLDSSGITPLGKQFIKIRIQDAGSGLASSTVTTLINGTISGNVAGTDYPAGATSPVLITVTKTDQSQRTTVTLRVTDVARNVTDCGTISTLVTREAGKPVTQTFTNIPKAESKIDVFNSTPGLTNLSITVNGKRFEVAGLKDGEVRTADVASAMVAGDNNSMTLEARGKPDGSAVIVVHG